MDKSDSRSYNRRRFPEPLPDAITYIVRYGEISTKGRNKKFFIKQLINNCKRAAHIYGARFDVYRHLLGRLTVKGKDLECLQTVFGVVSISKAIPVEKDLDKIKEVALNAVKDLDIKTLSVKTKRRDKSFPLTNPQISVEVVEHICRETGFDGKVKGADYELGIEIGFEFAYVFAHTIKGFAGLPVGSGSRAIASIRNEADALAAILILKRGTKVSISNGDAPKNLKDLLVAYGAEISDRQSPYEVSSQTLKTLENYHSSTLYPLIAYDEDRIKNEFATYAKVHAKFWHEN